MAQADKTSAKTNSDAINKRKSFISVVLLINMFEWSRPHPGSFWSKAVLYGWARTSFPVLFFLQLFAAPVRHGQSAGHVLPADLPQDDEYRHQIRHTDQDLCWDEREGPRSLKPELQ